MHLTRSLCLGAFLMTVGAAIAETADRLKPVELEADKVTVDDKKQTQLFEGAVQLTQGSIQIRAARLEVKQDANGYQKGIASGDASKQAWFKQKRQAREDYVEGRADRIEHDGKNEITEFFGKAWVKSGLDEVTGPYIRYDGKSENYVVNNQSAAGVKQPAGEGTGGRVRAVIQPKDSPTAAPAPAKH